MLFQSRKTLLCSSVGDQERSVGTGCAWDYSPGKSIKDGGLGYSCIAEIRMVETILKGKPLTPFMKFGDSTRIDMKGKDGSSIFGEIKQIVKKIKT